LTSGIEAAERVLHKSNEAVNRVILDESLEDLVIRVDDWKNHKVSQFGQLLLQGSHQVTTGKSDQEKEVSGQERCIQVNTMYHDP
jgi:cell division control protein 24